MNITNHAVKRFRDRIDASMTDAEEIMAAIRDSIMNGAVLLSDEPGGATLRTRLPYAMRAVVRNNSVVTVKWPSGPGGNRWQGIRRSRTYRHADKVEA